MRGGIIRGGFLKVMVGFEELYVSGIVRLLVTLFGVGR